MNLDNFNKIAAEIHKGNVDRGFYDEPKQIGTQLMLVVSELAEALEADRKGQHANLEEYYKKPFSPERFKEFMKDSFEDEIADTFIRLFDLVGWLDIDIESHIYSKLKYNASRPYKHGKKY